MVWKTALLKELETDSYLQPLLLPARVFRMKYSWLKASHSQLTSSSQSEILFQKTEQPTQSGSRQRKVTGRPKLDGTCGPGMERIHRRPGAYQERKSRNCEGDDKVAYDGDTGSSHSVP